MIHNIISPRGSYFAGDGSYGSAKNVVIVDTDSWTEEDWARIEDASDEERPDIAGELGTYYWSASRKNI